MLPGLRAGPTLSGGGGGGRSAGIGGPSAGLEGARERLPRPGWSPGLNPPRSGRRWGGRGGRVRTAGSARGGRKGRSGGSAEEKPGGEGGNAEGKVGYNVGHLRRLWAR